jgi:hypothetical protein
MTTQYEYRKAKEEKARIAEATSAGNGYVVLGGGKSVTNVREIMRPGPGQPLALPFDEVTPVAANPQLYGNDGAPTRKVTVQKQSRAVNEADEHYGLTPTHHEQEDSND